MEDGDVVGVFRTQQLTNRQRRNRIVIAPQNLRVHDVVETELFDNLKHLADVVLVDPCERLVERDDIRRRIGRFFISGITCCEERDIHRHRFLPAAELIEFIVRQLAFRFIRSIEVQDE